MTPLRTRYRYTEIHHFAPANTHTMTTISLAAPAMSFKLTMGMSPF